MKRIVYALTIVLLYFISVSAQSTPLISLPFNMYDNAGGQKALYFGVDPAATDSIDESLGESDLPPFPPPGIFETRFILPAGNYSGSLSSYKDYRFAPGIPFADTIEYRLKYQESDGADTMFFQWNLPIGITALMQDIITGTLVNVPMADSGVFGLTNIAAFNQMKLLVYFDVVPVELTSFTANVVGNTVILHWTTGTETNNRGFEVERSTDGTLFSILSFIQGNGTTTEPRSYSYSDKPEANGSYYYRLKQVDFNGSYEYSNVVEVNFNQPAEYNLSQNYPNPFNPTTEILYQIPVTGNVSIKVYNLIGREIKTLITGQVKQGIHKVVWDGLNSEGKQQGSGIYIYRIITDEFVQSRKMILMK